MAINANEEGEIVLSWCDGEAIEPIRGWSITSLKHIDTFNLLSSVKILIWAQQTRQSNSLHEIFNPSSAHIL